MKPAPEVAENKGPSEFQCDDDFDDFDLEAYAETEQLAIANKRKERSLRLPPQPLRLPPQRSLRLPLQRSLRLPATRLRR